MLNHSNNLLFRKRHILKAVILLLSFTCISPAQWERYVYTVPDSAEYIMRDMFFINSSTGWAAGLAHNFIIPTSYWGVVISTHDGGVTWQKENVPITGPFRTINALDASSIVAASDSGTIVRTTNGGASWLLLAAPVQSSRSLWSTSFINSLTGWISSNTSSTYQTTNGGASWALVSGTSFTKIYFRDSQTGFGFNRSGLQRTTSGGASWTNVIPDSLITDFYFLDNNTGWCNSSHSLYFSNVYGKGWKTTDGGVTWNVIRSNDTLNFLTRLRFVDAVTGYAVNSTGSPSGFSFTTNSGAVWYNPCDYRYDFSNVFFPDAQHGFAGGTYFFFDKTVAGPGNYFNPYFARLQLYQNSNNFSALIRPGSFIYPNSLTMGGLEWPRGSGKSLIYSAGLSMMARINGRLSVIYSLYNNDLDFGHIDNSQTTSGRELGEYGIYQIKSGDGPGVADWDNWPVSQGAPVSGGQPLLYGNMTSFASLADGYNSYGNTYGNSLKAEIKLLAYTFNSPPPYDDIMFLKFSITNRSGQIWDSTYTAIFADPDVGDASDDRVGTDSLLNLSYAYNGTNNDPVYGAAPPAVGFKLLESPLTGNQANSALAFFNLGYGCLSDPLDSSDIYMYFHAKDKCGQPFIFNNSRKFFVYDGDPETNTGWVMNEQQDVRLTLSAGPFKLKPDSSTIFTVAIIAARGNSNLNSVTRLKQIAGQLPIGIESGSTNIPAHYSLSQNYPNPFNPVTTIRFSIPKLSSPPYQGGDKGGVLTTLRVYDILGREVATLVNSPLAPGEYKVTWNASAFASGVYFYRLESGTFTDTKKMVLVK